MALHDTLLDDDVAITEVFLQLTEFERGLLASLLVLEEGNEPGFLNSLMAILATSMLRIEKLEQHIKNTNGISPKGGIDRLQ